jgi:hypothetical protein
VRRFRTPHAVAQPTRIPSNIAKVRGTGLEPARLAAPEPKASASDAKPLDLLESESPGVDRKSLEETEYRHSVQESGDEVERTIWRALAAWREGDPERARAALGIAQELISADLIGHES